MSACRALTVFTIVQMKQSYSFMNCDMFFAMWQKRLKLLLYKLLLNFFILEEVFVPITLTPALTTS